MVPKYVHNFVCWAGGMLCESLHSYSFGSPGVRIALTTFRFFLEIRAGNQRCPALMACDILSCLG